MSERRKRSKASTKTIAYIGAGLVHIVIIAAMLFNFTSKTETVDAVDADTLDVVIKANTVSEAQIKQQQDQIRQKDREKERQKEREEKRIKDLKREAEQEQKRIERLEKERKAIALKKKKEEEKRKKELAEKKEKEKKEKERKEKIAADKKKAEDAIRVAREQKRLDDEERLRQQILQEESARIEGQRTTTLIGRYSARIRDAINAKRVIAPDFERWRKTKLNIKLSPQGGVIAVSIVESSGSDRYDRSAETAVRQASPLPIPPFEESQQAHERFRDFNLNITMPGA